MKRLKYFKKNLWAIFTNLKCYHLALCCMITLIFSGCSKEDEPISFEIERINKNQWDTVTLYIRNKGCDLTKSEYVIVVHSIGQKEKKTEIRKLPKIKKNELIKITLGESEIAHDLFRIKISVSKYQDLLPNPLDFDPREIMTFHHD